MIVVAAFAIGFGVGCCYLVTIDLLVTRRQRRRYLERSRLSVREASRMRLW